MLVVILRRILFAIPLILIVVAITFAIGDLLPGDPAAAIIGANGTEEQYLEVRKELGLDLPLWQRYFDYLIGLLSGNMGSSLFSQEPVTAIIARSLPVSLSLVIGSVIIAAIVGIALGIASAAGRRASRTFVDVLSLAGIALPAFWVGLALTAVFAVQLRWFPVAGYTDFTTDPLGWARGLVLPVLTLSLAGIGIVAKQVRDGMLTAMESEHIRVLRASGVPEKSLFWKHALKNSSLPVVTVLGLIVVTSLTGTILVESVFGMSGFGKAVVDATLRLDFPVIQGVALTMTIFVVIVNLLVDIAYGLLNPRVRTA